MKNRDDFMNFLKWWYEFEHNRHLKMNASMATVFAVQTAVVGIIFSVFESNLSAHKEHIYPFLFLLASALLSILSIVFSIKSFWGQEYEFIGDPDKVSEIFKNRIDWADYRQKYNVGDPEEDLSALYEDYCWRFCKSIHTTSKSNDEKSGFRHRSIGMLLPAVACLAVSFVYYALVE